MSINSQPFGTMTFNAQQNSGTKSFQPKYMIENTSKQCNSHSDQQVNKLPLNLLMSAAEYNKMLITCGKNRKRPISHLNDGFVVNLEYINDEVFQKLNEQRALSGQNVHHVPKSTKKQVDQCTCCCCSEYCQQCANQNKKQCKTLSQSEVKKAFRTIDNEIAMVRKGSKVSQNTSFKKTTNKLQFTQSRRAKSAVSDSRSQKTHQVQIHPGVDISHLIIKSLIDFEESKKREAFLKESNKNTQKVKEEFMNIFNTKIRKENYEESKNSISKPKAQSLSKSKASIKYWDRVKSEVFENLKKDNYSATLKKQLQNYQFNVYGNQELPKREIKFTKDQINKLRQKHEIQAIKIIQQEKKQKEEREKEIKRKMRNLDQKRLEHIMSQPQKKFKPTEQMISSAFKNILEPKKVLIEEYFQSNTAKNQGLKKHSRKQILQNKKQTNKN